MSGLRSPAGLNITQTPNPGGIAGDAAGFWVLWAGIVQSQTAIASTDRWVGGRTAGAAGYYYGTRLLNNTTRAFMYDGGAAIRGFPQATITAGLVGRMISVMHVFDGSFLRTYFCRADVGSPVAVTGFTAAATRQVIGTSAPGNPAGADQPDVYGVLGGDGAGVPSLADYQSWCDIFKSTGVLPDMPNVPAEHLYRIPISLGTISDDGSAADSPMSVVGSPVIVSSGQISWGW